MNQTNPADDPELKRQFLDELKAIQNDKCLIVLDISRLEAWCMYVQVDFVLRNPINTGPTSDIARSFLQKLRGVIALTPALNKMAEAHNSKPDGKLLINCYQELMATADDQITVALTKIEAWTIMCEIQVALRHPKNQDTMIAQMVKSVAINLQSQVSDSPALAQMAEMGWNPEYDQ